MHRWNECHASDCEAKARDTDDLKETEEAAHDGGEGGPRYDRRAMVLRTIRLSANGGAV